jgi:hypothetical protein
MQIKIIVLARRVGLNKENASGNANAKLEWGEMKVDWLWNIYTFAEYEKMNTTLLLRCWVLIQFVEKASMQNKMQVLNRWDGFETQQNANFWLLKYTLMVD